MNVLSCFDGISCARVALERAGVAVDTYYASEIDKHAITVAQKNHPNTIQLGSIDNWKEWDLAKIDIIVGGSPCQGFSMAGKMLNFEDPRSKLFFTFADIVDHYRAINPDLVFVLENVSMESWCKEVISERLGVDPVEFNGALVSAQNRVRLWWTNLPVEGKPKDKGIFLKDILESEVDKKYYVSDKVLARLDKSGGVDADLITHNLQPRTGKGPGGKGHLFKTDNKSYAVDTGCSQAIELRAVVNNNGILSEREKSLAIDANYHKGMDNHGQRTFVANSGGNHSDMDLILTKSNGARVRSEKDKAETFLSTSHKGPEANGSTLIAHGVNHPSRGIEIRPDEKAASVKASAGESGTQKPKVFLEYEGEPFLSEPEHVHGEPRVYRGKSQTLQARMGTGGNNVPYVNNIRRLTEVEVERLFTLPDGYTEGISSTGRYRCLGNGWCVDAAVFIFSFIGQPLRNHRRQPKLFS